MTEGAVRISTRVFRSSFIMLWALVLGPSRKFVPPLVTTPTVPAAAAVSVEPVPAAAVPEEAVPVLTVLPAL